MKNYENLLKEVAGYLAEARRNSARAVNSVMTATYWLVGRRIVEFEQGGKDRAAYGEVLLTRLADDLTAQFGRGFSRQNIQLMGQFYLFFPLSEIRQKVSGKSSPEKPADSGSISATVSRKSNQVNRATPSLKSEHSVGNLKPLISQTLSTQSKSQTPSGKSGFLEAVRVLSDRFPLFWSHYVRLLSVGNPKARAFYEAEALRGGWSVRQLDHQVSSLFYERTAMSKNKASMFREEYLFEALA